MSPGLSRWLRIALGAGIGLFCLWLALRGVPFARLGHALSGAGYVWLAPAFALQLLAIVARARRWTVLLEQRGRLVESFWAQGVGYLFTNVLPLRLGEAARVTVMAQRCGLPLVQVAASAVVERLLDVLTILLALALALPWVRIPAAIGRAGLLLAGLAFAASALLLLAVRLDDWSEGLLRSLGCALPALPTEGLVRRWRELVAGLSPLTHLAPAVGAVLWSVATWALSMAVYWCFLRAFRADAAPIEAVFMVVALSLAVSAPSSPAHLGVFEVVGQQALAVPFAGRYDLAQALAITLTAHLAYYALTTGLGIVALWRLGQSFAGLGQAIAAGRS